MQIVPIVIAKNEEIWVGRVLSALASTFQNVIVADTGSTDNTLNEISKIVGVTLMAYKNLAPNEIGLLRGDLQAFAKKNFGASHVFLCDADELYPIKYLRFIVDNMMPENSMSGYTSGVECTELENGELWFLGNEYGNVVGLNRQAIFSVEAKWSGLYPFESPDTYQPGNSTNHYFLSPGPGYNFYHLHQVKRSSKDQDVYLRMQKKFQFSMQDAPQIKPLAFWIKSQSDYVDE